MNRLWPRLQRRLDFGFLNSFVGVICYIILQIPVTIVFTKCDRRKKKKNGGKPPDENVAEFEKQLQESYSQTPPWIMTSSTTGQGKDELLKHMTRLRDYWSN